MLSILELRQIIESGLLPLSSRCDFGRDGTLGIKIFDRNTGRVEVSMGGIVISKLTTSREISQLIAEVRSEHEIARSASPLLAATRRG
ncbi:MAG: hypothetical protein JWQ79_4156 [Mucilaginibacter sp.]|nr:hypothetical protein [Mucilaginibacter sp.]